MSLEKNLKDLAKSLELRAGYSASGAFQELKQVEIIRKILETLPATTVGATSETVKLDETSHSSSTTETVKPDKTSHSSTTTETVKPDETGQSSLANANPEKTGPAKKRGFDDVSVPKSYVAKRLLDRDMQNKDLSVACQKITLEWNLMDDTKKEKLLEQDSKRFHEDNSA